MLTFARQTAIAGIGATEFSKDSGRTPMQLATEACLAACEDAGLDPSLVDGMSVFSSEKNTEIEVARNLGVKQLTHFSMVNHGGGAPCGVVAARRDGRVHGRRRLRARLPGVQRAVVAPLRAPACRTCTPVPRHST